MEVDFGMCGILRGVYQASQEIRGRGNQSFADLLSPRS